MINNINSDDDKTKEIRKRTIWDYLKYFKPDPNKWGDPSKMDGSLLLTMDALRAECSMPIVINCGYATSGHAKHSYHYKGMACDWHFLLVPKTVDDFKDQVKLVLEACELLQIDQFIGLGIYPYWHRPGFHLDVRGFKARWVRDKDNQYHYWADIDELFSYFPNTYNIGG